MTEQENDITQPVPLKPAPSADISEVDTQPVNVAPESQKNPLPEWLLKFAAAPEQPEEPQVSPKTIPVVFEEDENFIPPVLPEDITNENIEHMPTCSVVAFKISAESWKEFKNAEKNFLFFHNPKEI